MANFGLTPSGFKRKRQEDILNDLRQAVVEELGPVNTNPDSTIGQLLGVISQPISDLWQEAENVYHSQYVASAEEVSLDNVVDLVGVQRLAATKTRVTAILSGNQGVNIPTGTQIRAQESGELFTNPAPGQITRTNAVRVLIEVPALIDNTNYNVVINGNPFNYNTSVGQSINIVAESLAMAINAGSEPVVATFLGSGQLEIVSEEPVDPFSCAVSPNLNVIERSSPLLFEAVELGPILAVANTVNEIVTPVSGWDSVNNPVDGIIGRRRETDEELRLRRLNSLRVAGAASVDAIRARLLQEVQDVMAVLIFENREPFPDSQGRPPHSFEVLVQGGDEQEIAEKIWELKPAGIQTFGNICRFIIDSNNDSQQICFSRPDPIFIWVRIGLRVNPATFPLNGIEAVRENVFLFGQTYGVGEKILYQPFFESIYKVQGILEATLELATSTNVLGPPGTFVMSNLSLNDVQLGLFDPSRIQVTLTT